MIRKYSFNILIFVLFLTLLGFGWECFAQDFISVNHSAVVDVAQNYPVLELKPTNPHYFEIEKELTKLKEQNLGCCEILLDEASNQNIAPRFYEAIKKIVKNFVEATGIQMPQLILFTGQENKAYNASATTATKTLVTTTTVTRGKKKKVFTSESVEKEYKLTLGEGLLKLLFWKREWEDLLSGIIAHEIGHMVQVNKLESKEMEYQADAKAVELLGRKRSDKLIQAIDMITLANHIYNILTLNSELLRLNLGDAHQIIRIIVNSLINAFPDLGDLGRCSTHKKFGYVVNKVFQDALKYSLDPSIGMTETEFVKIYERLQRVCLSLVEYMGPDEEEEISKKYEFIENYTNQLYNHITHPTPLERRINIQECIKKSVV